MGRKSVLTVAQWEDIETRYHDGESAYSLAKDYGISASAIKKRFSDVRNKTKDLAIQLVSVETKINKLRNNEKTLVRTYADRLLALQNLAGDVATSGMKIAKRVSGAIEAQIDTMSNAELMDTENMKPLMAAGMVANTHAKMGIDMLNLATRSQAGIIQSEDEEIKTLADFYGSAAKP